MPQVRGRMHQLKEELFGKVAAVLDPAVAPEGADAPVPPAVNTGRWRAVFEKGARFWSRRGSAARGADARDEVQRQLEDLHADIQGQISAEVRVQVFPGLPALRTFADEQVLAWD